MDTYLVETYRYLRDHGKPVSQQDAADYAKLRAPQPPSRAHLARIARHAKNLPFVQPTLAPRELSEETQRNRMANAFFKEQMAQIGAMTRTIVPYCPAPLPRAQFVTINKARRDTEACSEADKLDAHRKHLARDTAIALSKRVYVEDQPDMFNVLDAFGDFDHYGKAITK